MSRLHFIFNPVAGSGASTQAFKQMEALLQAQNIDYSFSRSEYPGHALELTRQALSESHECIVAVGGDGTVREVAMEMAGSDVPMGMFPCGTGNDMVRALHIPRDPEAVLDILLNAVPKWMDAAEANGKLFFNVGGFGFDVDVLVNTARYKKYFKGLTAYMAGLFHSLSRLRLIPVRVTTPETTFTCNALLVAACNGTHFGGGMNAAPLADPTDGLLDICVAKDVNRLTILPVLSKFIKGKHLDLPYIQYFKATEITVDAGFALPVQVDGEVVEQTPVTFRVRPGALLVKTGL
ncbi:MAG TPA: diacylglycerol kinase family protein [Feifaniaceae bacterium]|nr:diacylglycerol kinase family protein [Feifaniaceae bacterium]